MKNFQQTPKQKRVTLAKGKAAYVNSRKPGTHMNAKKKQLFLDAKQHSYGGAWYLYWSPLF